MAKKNKTIEVCVGIGMDQLTPEYIVIEIPNVSKQDNNERTRDDQSTTRTN